MKKLVWISYDLSVKGDYEGLYAWLDDHDAKECGDSIASFSWDDKDNGDIPSQVKESLLSNFEYDEKKDRIYIIYKKETEGKTTVSGKFILGRRKANPWTGYGMVEKEEEYEEY
jgi:hypothetical protein